MTTKQTGASWEDMARGLKKILRGGLRAEVPMAKYTTIGVGGNARLLAEPSSFAQVAHVVRYAHEHDLNYIVVGKGTELLRRMEPGTRVPLGGPLAGTPPLEKGGMNCFLRCLWWVVNNYSVASSPASQAINSL